MSAGSFSLDLAPRPPKPRRFNKLRFIKPNNKSGKGSKDFGSPLGVIFKVIAIFILSQIAAVVITEGVLALFYPHTDLASLLNDLPSGQFLFVLIAEAGAVGLVYMLLKRRGLRLAAIGLGRKPRWYDVKKAVAGFLAFYLLLIIGNLVLGWVFPILNSNETQDVGFNTLNSAADQIFAFLALVILPPLGEEPLVRGYLFGPALALEVLAGHAGYQPDIRPGAPGYRKHFCGAVVGRAGYVFIINSPGLPA